MEIAVVEASVVVVPVRAEDLANDAANMAIQNNSMIERCCGMLVAPKLLTNFTRALFLLIYAALIGLAIYFGLLKIEVYFS